jgi:hypothetical protein
LEGGLFQAGDYQLRLSCWSCMRSSACINLLPHCGVRERVPDTCALIITYKAGRLSTRGKWEIFSHLGMLCPQFGLFLAVFWSS